MCGSNCKCQKDKDVDALKTIVDILVDTNTIAKVEDDKTARLIDEAYDLGFKDGLEQGKIRERNTIRSMINSIDPYDGSIRKS